MKHYTLSTLFLLIAILHIPGFTPLYAQEYKLYQECDEYYDSRGFYHRKCANEDFKRNKAMKEFNRLYDFVEPGTGPVPLADKNSTATSPIDTLFTPPKSEKRDKPLAYENDREEEELSQPESEIKQIKSNNQALKERPKLEFGRE